MFVQTDLFSIFRKLFTFQSDNKQKCRPNCFLKFHLLSSAAIQCWSLLATFEVLVIWNLFCRVKGFYRLCVSYTNFLSSKKGISPLTILQVKMSILDNFIISISSRQTRNIITANFFEEPPILWVVSQSSKKQLRSWVH